MFLYGMGYVILRRNIVRNVVMSSVGFWICLVGVIFGVIMCLVKISSIDLRDVVFV